MKLKVAEKGRKYGTNSMWRITWAWRCSQQSKKTFCHWFQWSTSKLITQETFKDAHCLSFASVWHGQRMDIPLSNHTFIFHCFGKSCIYLYLSFNRLGMKGNESSIPHITIIMSLQQPDKFRLVTTGTVDYILTQCSFLKPYPKLWNLLPWSYFYTDPFLWSPANH